MFSAQVINAQKCFPDGLYITSKIQIILSTLFDNLSRFKEMLENNEKDDKNYDEYKNIWLSTTLAVNINIIHM